MQIIKNCSYTAVGGLGRDHPRGQGKRLGVLHGPTRVTEQVYLRVSCELLPVYGHCNIDLIPGHL